MKVLVTGASGFVGRYLVKELLSKGHEVIFLGLTNGNAISDINVKNYEIDILRNEDVLNVFNAVRPEAVIHLAAQSNVPKSWLAPALTSQVNITGTINVLEAFNKYGNGNKFINIGSGDEYGMTARNNALLTEDMVCLPQNPYAITKYCSEQMVLKLGVKYQMDVVTTRSFNHFGPYQDKGFVVSDFASQIAEIKKGLKEPVIYVGDTSASRDFLYVEDVVNAYVALLENKVASGVYNVSSGIAISISEILNTLLKLSNEDIEIKIDGSRFRPVDVNSFAGCNEKLRKSTGWSYKDNFANDLEKTLNYWVNKIGGC